MQHPRGAQQARLGGLLTQQCFAPCALSFYPQELEALLEEDKLANASILIYANKQDLAGAAKVDEVRCLR